MRFSHISLFALTGLSLASPVVKRDSASTVVDLLTDLYATVQTYTGAISQSLPSLHPSIKPFLTRHLRRYSRPLVAFIQCPRQDRRNRPSRRSNQPDHRGHHFHNHQDLRTPTPGRIGARGTLHFYRPHLRPCQQREAPNRRHRHRRAPWPHHRRSVRDCWRRHPCSRRRCFGYLHDTPHG
jgi:hypothetical protein